MGVAPLMVVVLWSLRMRDNQRGEENLRGRLVFVQPESWGGSRIHAEAWVLGGTGFPAGRSLEVDYRSPSDGRMLSDGSLTVMAIVMSSCGEIPNIWPEATIRSSHLVGN